MNRETQLRIDFPHLRFSPSILKRLGEELNPNPDHGLLELVKNAYDADARECTVTLVDTHEPGGTVVITDDGVGMDRETIEEQWLVLGQSSKSIHEPTKLGRIPVGNKGLGRLAALRLGNQVSLFSRPQQVPQYEYQLDIDWRDFDNATVVEEVELDIRRSKRPSGAEQGTTITISGLRSRLARMDVKRLARGIVLLADPFVDNPIGFRPKLDAVEFRDLEKLVQRRYFDDAEFHLLASVDKDGAARATVADWKGNTLFSADHAQMGPKSADQFYRCPAATFDLWAFILDEKTFSARPTTKGEVQEWLSEFGGVHLYVRGFRAAPYGNPGNDWLDMNLSRVQSPEVRPGTNSAIGRIAVTDPGETLVQKTDRSGLIEGPEFLELKRFATDALNWMARERRKERDRRRANERVEAPTRVTATRESVEQAIEKLPARSRVKLKAAFGSYERAREREVNAWKKEVQLYRTLSTAGITSAVFAHESKQPLRLIQQNIKQVERIGQEHLRSKYEETLARPVDRIQRQADSLQAFGNLTLSQIDHEKRRTGRVDLHEVINIVKQMFDPFAAQRKAHVRLQLDAGNPYLRASQAAIESLLTNLLANSLKAFEATEPGDHTIVVRTQVGENAFVLRVLDNGPGIRGIGVADIWLPGESTYPNGTGLGLTIVRDTVQDLGGSVGAIAQGELGGAEIIVQLPILGA